MNQENIKIVEIRDRATFIPALALRMIAENKNKEERFLFNQMGYRLQNDPYILLISLADPSFSARYYDEWERKDMGRTMTIAHKYIEENFDSIVSCQVIDVEFLQGEKAKPCLSAFEEELKEFVELGLAIQTEKEANENSKNM